MKCSKKIANKITLFILALAVIYMMVALEHEKVLDSGFGSIVKFLVIPCVFLFVGAVFLFLGNRDLQHKLKAIQLKKGQLLEKLDCCRDEIQESKQRFYQVLQARQDTIEDLLSQKTMLDIVPNLENLLNILKTLNTDYCNFLEKKCEVFVEHLEETKINYLRKEFDKDSFAEKEEMQERERVNLHITLVECSCAIGNVTDEIENTICTLIKLGRAQADMQDFIAQLKDCIDYTQINLHDSTLFDLTQGHKVNIDKFKACVLQERAILNKITGVKETPEVINNHSVTPLQGPQAMSL